MVSIGLKLFIFRISLILVDAQNGKTCLFFVDEDIIYKFASFNDELVS